MTADEIREEAIERVARAVRRKVEFHFRYPVPEMIVDSMASAIVNALGDLLPTDMETEAIQRWGDPGPMKTLRRYVTEWKATA